MTVSRVGARIVLLDETDRVLLIHERIEGPVPTHWLTPGGGVERGENLVIAATREVFEETGMWVDLPPDASVVHRQRRQWSWHGVTYDQVDHFFLATVTSAAAITPARLTTMQRETLIEHRWWSLHELERTRDRIEPPDLAQLLVSLCRHPRVPA
jgi:ADP-ribose pyrophosphatase YjhB (NUDIX family)